MKKLIFNDTHGLLFSIKTNAQKNHQLHQHKQNAGQCQHFVRNPFKYRSHDGQTGDTLKYFFNKHLYRHFKQLVANPPTLRF